MELLYAAALFGILAGPIAHDLGAQALQEQPLRPLAGTCPRCGTQRGWLRSRCPTCERRVSREWLYVFAAILGAMAFANTVGWSWVLVSYAGFLVLSLALVATDLDALRIVDRLNLPGTGILVVLLGLGAALDSALGSYGRAVLGALAYFAGTNLMFLLVRGRGFGYGDVKLSVQLGLFSAFVSWGTLGWSVFATALIGGLLSVLVLAGGVVSKTRARRAADGPGPSMREVMKRELPYGPSMVAGTWLAIFLAGIGAFPIPA